MTTTFGETNLCRSVNDILGRVGDKWTMLVVIALKNQPRRFNDVKRHVDGISQQMLTRTLKALERDGLVERTVRDTTPPQVEYALTALGHSLSSTVSQLAKWTVTHFPAIHANRSDYDAKIAMRAEDAPE